MNEKNESNKAKLIEIPDYLNESNILILQTQGQQKIIEEIQEEGVGSNNNEEQKQVKNNENINQDSNIHKQEIKISSTTNYETLDEIPTQRFFVDVKEQSSLGNILPWVFSIENQIMKIDELDYNENSLLHKAAQCQQLDIVVVCIEKFKFDVNLPHKQGAQTALMIASLLGNLKMVKYLIDKGADVNAKDTNGFSSIMNAVFNRHKFIATYLLANNADYQVLDKDGCNLAHRAAFNNDVEMLQILYAVDKYQFQQIDKFKLTPLGRAITNESHQAFEYLQRVRPIQISNTANRLQNKYMTQLIYQEYQKQNLNYYSQRGMVQMYNKYPKLICLLFYSAILIFMNRVIQSQTLEVDSRSEFYERTHLISQIISILVFLTVYSFIFTTQCPSKKLIPRKKLLQSQDFNSLHEIEFTHLNTLFQRQSQNPSKLHNDFNLCDYIFALIKTEKFNKLCEINSLSFCFECLDLKREREHHCQEINSCIPGLSHFSKFFNKLVVSQENRLHYQIILFIQFITILLFFILNYLFCNSKYTFQGVWLLSFAEIPFIFFQAEQFAFLFAYILGILFFYLAFINLFVEIVCIIFRVTQYEIFNPQLCQEFYPTSNIQQLQQSSRFLNPNTDIYFRFYKNPYSRCLSIEPSIPRRHEGL